MSNDYIWFNKSITNVIPCDIVLSINLQISDLIGINWQKLSLGSFQVTLNSLNASIPSYVEKLTKKLRTLSSY